MLDELFVAVRKRMHALEIEWERSRKLLEGKHFFPADMELTRRLEDALFALECLPVDAAPIIVMETDGVSELSNMAAYDNILMQLSRLGVQCHVIQV